MRMVNNRAVSKRVDNKRAVRRKINTVFFRVREYKAENVSC